MEDVGRFPDTLVFGYSRAQMKKLFSYLSRTQYGIVLYNNTLGRWYYMEWVRVWLLDILKDT
jgi:hypothetical protein